MQKLTLLSKTNNNSSHKKMTSRPTSYRDKNKENIQTEPSIQDSAFTFKKTNEYAIVASKNRTFQKLFIEDLEPMRLKSHRSKIEDSSINKSVASRESSNQKHALKPCPAPKIQTNYDVFQQFSKRGNINSLEAQMNENNKNLKKENSSLFVNQFVKIQAWEQTKNDTIQSLDQLKRHKNPERQIKIQNNCQKHSLLNTKMEDMENKFQHVSQKLSLLQAKNVSLYEEIEEAKSSNYETEQILSKLKEQKQELLYTKDKWQKSKQKLEVLYVQIWLRVAKEKEKDDIGKEDCQNYFATRTKETKVTPKQQERKTNLASRIKLRVQRT